MNCNSYNLITFNHEENIQIINPQQIIHKTVNTFELKSEKSILKKILSGIGILLSGLFCSIGLSEFYNVRIKKETDFYPFDGEGPVPYYYKTAELYSNVNLTYGIAFGILLIIGIWNWRKNKINGFVILGLICILILIQILHGRTE